VVPIPKSVVVVGLACCCRHGHVVAIPIFVLLPMSRRQYNVSVVLVVVVVVGVALNRCPRWDSVDSKIVLVVVVVVVGDPDVAVDVCPVDVAVCPVDVVVNVDDVVRVVGESTPTDLHHASDHVDNDDDDCVDDDDWYVARCASNPCIDPYSLRLVVAVHPTTPDTR